MPGKVVHLARQGAFVSYARADGETFARDLRVQLQERGIQVWRDREHMQGGRDWWLQIVDALNHVEYMVLVMTPAAMASDIVRKEWRYARQQGVAVLPVIAAAGLAIDALPRWMRDVHWYDLDHQRERFFGDLKQRRPMPRVPHMAEPLAAHFVPRVDKLQSLKSLLLSANRDEPVAITAALRGAAGYGKTTMARALCADDDIQNAFDDGILWVTLGEQPGPVGLLSRLTDLIETLAGERPGFESLEAASTRLRELIADRDILLVIDDVWRASDLAPFLYGGRRCGRLVTTRRADALPSNARTVMVNKMAPPEAVALLVHGLETFLVDPLAADCAPASGLDSILSTLAGRLGQWPLLLMLGNAWLRKRVIASHQPIASALQALEGVLDKHGIVAFDANSPEERNQAAARTLELSLEGLCAEDRARLMDLAIFDPDLAIPMAVLDRWWAVSAGIESLAVDETCQRLFDESLLAELDLAARYLRLHDVMRDWLRRRLGSAELARCNDSLLRAYSSYSQAWAMQPDDGYLHQHLPQHLVAANRTGELRALLLDLDWMLTRLRASGSILTSGRGRPPSAAVDVYGLVSAYQLVPDDDDLRLVQLALRMSTHVLVREPAQLPFQLFGRLGVSNSVSIRRLCKNALDSLSDQGLVPVIPALAQPGALELTLQGHEGEVQGATLLADDQRVLSWSVDCTLRLWDLQQGRVLWTLKGHDRRVDGAMLLSDRQRALTWSDDCTLKLWDLRHGSLLQTLQGHDGWVVGATVLADGQRVLSWSDDLTVRLWDLQQGRELCKLKGHEGRIYGATLLADGQRVLSWSVDSTLRLWDLQQGRELRKLEGHEGRVYGATLLAEVQQILSWSEDGTLRLWDLLQGRLLRTLKGHDGRVDGAKLLADGHRVLSWSDDRTLRLWDLPQGCLLRTLKGHDDRVVGAALLPGEQRVLSWSEDRTLKVWDLQKDQSLHTLEGHKGRVDGATLLADGQRALSWSTDRTLRLWDLQQGRLLRTLQGHEGWIGGAALLADGLRALSWSVDRMLRLWDLQHGQLLQAPQGHDGRVGGAMLMADGQRVLSRSDDRTLRLWDLRQGRLLQTLHGHEAWVDGATPLPNAEQVLSWSDDRTLRLWDLNQGLLLQTLRGHGGRVYGATLLSNAQQLLSWSDDCTLILWDLQRARLLQTLQGHESRVGGAVALADGRRVLSWSDDCTLILWDLKKGRMLQTLQGHEGRVDGALLLSGTRRVLSWSEDCTLRLWDLRQGRLLRTLQGHGERVDGAALLSGGRRALSWSVDCTLRLWDLGQGRLQRTLQGHEGRVGGATLLSDGRRALSWSEDGTLRLWDLRHDRPLRTLQGHEGRVDGATLLLDARQVLSWSDDGTVRLWDVSTATCVATYRADSAITVACVATSLGRAIAFDMHGRTHLIRLG